MGKTGKIAKKTAVAPKCDRSTRSKKNSDEQGIQGNEAELETLGEPKAKKRRQTARTKALVTETKSDIPELPVGEEDISTSHASTVTLPEIPINSVEISKSQEEILESSSKKKSVMSPDMGTFGPTAINDDKKTTSADDITGQSISAKYIENMKLTSMSGPELLLLMNSLHSHMLAREDKVVEKQGGEASVVQLGGTLDTPAEIAKEKNSEGGTTEVESPTIVNADVTILGTELVQTTPGPTDDASEMAILHMESSDTDSQATETVIEDFVTDLVNDDDTWKVNGDGIAHLAETEKNNNNNGDEADYRADEAPESSLGQAPGGGFTLNSAEDINGSKTDLTTVAVDQRIASPVPSTNTGRSLGSRENPVIIDDLLAERDKILLEVENGRKRMADLKKSKAPSDDSTGITEGACKGKTTETNTKKKTNATKTDPKKKQSKLDNPNDKLESTTVLALRCKLAKAEIALKNAERRILLLERNQEKKLDRLFQEAMELKRAVVEITATLDLVIKEHWEKQESRGFFSFGDRNIAVKYVDKLLLTTETCRTYFFPRLCQMAVGVDYCLNHVIVGRVGMLNFEKNILLPLMNFTMYQFPGMTERKLGEHYNTYNGNFWNPENQRPCLTVEEFLELPQGEVMELIVDD